MLATQPTRFGTTFLNPRVCEQALASERELLVSLFDHEAGSPEVGQPGSVITEELRSPHSRPPSTMNMPSTAALLDQVFESICRPLKVLCTSTVNFQSAQGRLSVAKTHVRTTDRQGLFFKMRPIREC